LRVGFSVDLQHDRLASHIRGSARNFWSRGSARATPTGPEVNEDGDGGVLDNIVKGSGVDSERLGERRKLGLASSTFAACSQVFCGDAIFLLAVGTGANDRHG
jgi:hypothetical protein